MALQDLGAAGLSSSTSEMASKGGVGIDLDVSRVPLREAGHGAVRGHDLRVAGADAVRRRAGPAGRGAGRLRALGDERDADRRRSPTRGACACSTASELVGDMPVPALVDECPLYDLEPAEPPDPLAVFAAAAADARRPRRAGGHAARAARLAQRRQPAVGVRAVRLPRRQPHGAPARAGRRRRAEAGARRATTPAGRSPSRSTATGAGSPATPTSARPRRSASAPPTSPASAPSRSA